MSLSLTTATVDSLDDYPVTAEEVAHFRGLTPPDRIRFLLRFIQDHPARWDQRWWVALVDGVTTRCFGGWAYAFWTGDRLTAAVSKFDEVDIVLTATQLLGLTHEQATSLFYCAFYSGDPWPYVERVAQVTGVRLVDELAGVGV